MDDITPDLVARVASRLYNEGLSSPGAMHGGPSMPAENPSSVGRDMPYGNEAATHSAKSFPSNVSPHVNSHTNGLPGSPGSTTIPSHSPEHSHSLPGVRPGLANMAIPDFLHAAAQRSPSPFAFPTPAGSMPTASPTPFESSAVRDQSSSDEGLRTFIQQIRRSHAPSRTATNESQFSFAPRINPTLAASNGGSRPLDIDAVRADFPILRQLIHGRPLAWFDNAATTQKPQSVIDAISRFYEQDNSNIHRAAHSLAARATDAYEKAREKVRAFLGAGSTKEIVFVRGTTEGINLITQTYGRKFLQPGDEIVLSVLEHHANIVPWQTIAREKGAVLRVIPVNDRGEIMLEEYQKLLGPKTKVVALTQASNSLGTILPVAEMTQMAKRYGARVLIDGAQSVAHIPVNMQQLGADFFVFSGHKIFGPTGIGAVYIREELHDILPPWQGGGNMIRNVTFEETTFSEAPAKFEAGTPNIADAVGLGAALDYVQHLGLPNIAAYEHQLLVYATERMLAIPGLQLIGQAREKVGVLSFVLPHKRTEDVGKLLDQEGIAVRAGHHCSQPSLRRFGLESTVRPSLSFYNTYGEVDRLVDAVKRICLMP